ncbi:zinc ribbon domain-containing protein [Cronobacter sakazakii]|uniref:zinc ribbon domain-containing protein n=1 Tax=Cronobacter sakazakii TaxID=28141 RepID=UPI001AA16066|nr:zinc ribbon domain-containing protein [Cronobacter sakazakii]
MALINCKECGEQVSTKAETCPKCGAPVSLRKKGPSGCMMLIIIAVSALVLILFLVNLSGGSASSNKSADSIKSNEHVSSNSEESDKVIDSVAQTSQPKKNWQEGSVKDEMTDKIRPYLANTSINGAEFNFPYNVDGGSKVTIVIRKDPKEKVAYVLIEKGFMLCSYQSCSIQTRSESGKIKKWEAVEASPGVHNVLFIRNAESFEKYIKENKKIRIGIEFYEYGVKSFDFDVSDYPGLK